MFDIGFWELAIISIVALLVLGPEKMPGLIRDVSKWARKIRRFVSQTRNEIEREFSLDVDNDLQSRISELDELVKNAPDKKPSAEEPPSEN